MTNAPTTLSRPLAARLAHLPAVTDTAPATLPTAPTLIEGAAAALDAGKTKYADRQGIGGLRTWVAQHLQSAYNVALSPDAVTITCGAEEARYVALAILLKVPLYPALVQEQSAQWDGVLYLRATDPREHIQALITAAPADMPILWDTRGTTDSYHPAQDPTLSARVTSFGVFDGIDEGWRVGWLAGGAAHGAMRAYKQSMTICTPSVSQWAALHHLEAGA